MGGCKRNTPVSAQPPPNAGALPWDQETAFLQASNCNFSPWPTRNTFTPSTQLPCPNFLLPDLTEKLTDFQTDHNDDNLPVVTCFPHRGTGQKFVSQSSTQCWLYSNHQSSLSSSGRTGSPSSLIPHRGHLPYSDPTVCSWPGCND